MLSYRGAKGGQREPNNERTGSSLWREVSERRGMAVGMYCDPYGCAVMEKNKKGDARSLASARGVRAWPKSDMALLDSRPWNTMRPCQGASVHATPLMAHDVSAT